MKRKFNQLTFLMLMLLLGASSAFAQTTIRGNITDDSGEALIGANVIVKGTSDGNVTDIDGNYTLTTSESFPLTLVFSYTGYNTQEIDVNSSAPVNVTLSEGLITDEIVISASRRKEKVQEAPASISVITARKLQSTANSTDATRNLISTPGVQIQQQSANRINISMRGGAGLFGTSVFPIMDYRSLVGPGIGTFQSDGAGISNLDLERIEVVRGPGSALYGPGVTQGVVHFITKSPIDHPCTSVELMGGELSTFGIGARHATKVSDKFGFKVNAQYRQGKEFTLDPDDPDDALQIAKFQTQIVQPAVSGNIVDVTGTPTVLLTQEELDPDGDGNVMSEDWHNLGINATLEFRPKDNLSIVTSGGFNAASSVFYNEQGEGLAQANEYWGQARLQSGGLFAQVFGVINDGGSEDNPTFLYQTGNRTPVGRTQLEGQVQYNFDAKKLLNSNWTAGVDYRFAGQDTENLVYGRNEDDDDYEVIGAYVQSKFELGKKLDLVLAGRYDYFSNIEEGAVAPRAALVFKASPKHTFRASYNRANSTVSNLQLNIDFPLSVIIPGSFDVWLYGNKTTQTFPENPMIEWFNPAIPSLPVGTPGLPVAVPYGAVAATVNTQIIAGIMNDPNLAPLAPIFQGALDGIDPNQLGFTGVITPGFNIFDGSPLGLTDAPISAIETLDAFEVGYKGLIGNKLGVTFDVYQNTQKNFSQFTAISPAYIYAGADALPGDLGAAVGAQFGANLAAGLATAGLPQAQIDAIVAGTTPLVAGGYTAGGDAFLNTVDPSTGLSLNQVLGLLPFHATTPTNEVPGAGGTHLAAGYRTFTERSYVGLDAGLEYYFTNDFTAFFNYSWVSDNIFMQQVVGFEGENDPELPSYLNIPQNKFRTGINYTPEFGFRGSVSFQHDDSYFASAGQFTGDTEERNLVDAAVGYKFNNGLAIDVSATNLFNNEYRYLPNMPKIGRRALAKLTYDFGCNKAAPSAKKIVMDRDGDGIKDSKDKCPDIAGIKKYKGCPMSDEDMAAAEAAKQAQMAAEAKMKAEAAEKAAMEAKMAAEAKMKMEAEAAEKAAMEAAAAAVVEEEMEPVPVVRDVTPVQTNGAMSHSHNGVTHSHANGGEHVHTNGSAVTGTATASDYTRGTGAYTHSHNGQEHSHDNNGSHEHTVVSTGTRDAVVSSVFESALQGINFRSSQDRFRSSSYTIMDNVVTVMNQYPNMTVTIEGHTDSQGGSASNQALSQKRADAVKAYLVSKGISSSRLSAIGYGEARPVADNTTSTGRERNRRVAFIPAY